MSQSRFVIFSSKRNLIAFSVWCVMLLALVAGITANCVLYSQGKIDDAAVYRRLWYAALCLAMMSAVYFFEAITRVRFSLFLELALSVFAFAALAGGTVFNLYGVFPGWDKVLHTLSGPLFSIVGFAFADLLLKNQPTGARKVLASVFIAFLFSLAVGYIWELFEYSVDSIIPGFNNQRWQAGVIEDLGNGTYLVSDARGTGLHDTMWDMFANFFGTVGFLLPVLVLLLKAPERLALFSVGLRPKKKK